MTDPTPPAPADLDLTSLRKRVRLEYVNSGRCTAAIAADLLAALETAVGRAEVAEGKVAAAWDEGSLAMRKARMVQGESLPQNPYRFRAALTDRGADQ